MSKPFLDVVMLFIVACMWATARPAVQAGTNPFVIAATLIGATAVSLWMVLQ